MDSSSKIHLYEWSHKLLSCNKNFYQVRNIRHNVSFWQCMVSGVSGRNGHPVQRLVALEHKKGNVRVPIRPQRLVGRIASAWEGNSNHARKKFVQLKEIKLLFTYWFKSNLGEQFQQIHASHLEVIFPFLFPSSRRLESLEGLGPLYQNMWIWTTNKRAKMW